MNGKTAKQIRATARDLTVGKPEKQYMLKNELNQTIILKPNCTRAVYKRLKHEYKKGELYAI